MEHLMYILYNYNVIYTYMSPINVQVILTVQLYSNIQWLWRHSSWMLMRSWEQIIASDIVHNICSYSLFKGYFFKTSIKTMD